MYINVCCTYIYINAYLYIWYTIYMETRCDMQLLSLRTVRNKEKEQHARIYSYIYYIYTMQYTYIKGDKRPSPTTTLW